MDAVVTGLVLLSAGLSATVLVLNRALKQTKADLKLLLRESETVEKSGSGQSGDLYFKIDKNFNIIFADEAGVQHFGFATHSLDQKPLLGSLIDDTPANRGFLEETFAKISKKPTTFNTQMLIKRCDGKNMLLLVRIRPILNEILKCDGLSFLCKDISQANHLENELIDFQSIDPFTNILNETTLKKRFAHDFNLATRYNKELSAITLELKDIYDFIAHGIDFETADKMLKDISLICLKAIPEGGYAGRVDKTKIVLVLPDANRGDALKISGELLGQSVMAIRALRIDEANAQMIIISYSNRKGFTDSFDAMTGRLQRHIATALKQKEYGIISSDCRQTTVINLENIKG